jgi:hypothetical protein
LCSDCRGKSHAASSRRRSGIAACAKSSCRIAARVADVGTMGGSPTYVERATEGTGCLPAKLERAIDCMRLIAGRTARPSLGISVICERCSYRSLVSCSVAALWWGAEAIGLAAALR